MTDAWGPWTPGLSPAERAQRCRRLSALVIKHAIPSVGHGLAEALDAGQVNDDALARALRLFEALPAWHRRNLMAAWLGPTRQAKQPYRDKSMSRRT
jgi:hypothetical protein